MYLEAKFEDGAVGFYPVTASSTVTITEPPANESTQAASVAFSTQGIRSLQLVDGEIPTLPEHDAPASVPAVDGGPAVEPTPEPPVDATA